MRGDRVANRLHEFALIDSPITISVKNLSMFLPTKLWVFLGSTLEEFMGRANTRTFLRAATQRLKDRSGQRKCGKGLKLSIGER